MQTWYPCDALLKRVKNPSRSIDNPPVRSCDVNPGQLDLNLLKALDALLEEQHVTRAAERCGLSEPAMSRSLGKLRHLFGDELLIRVGREYHLTPFSSELMLSVHDIVERIDNTLARRPAFEPTNDRRAIHDRRFRLQRLFANALADETRDGGGASSVVTSAAADDFDAVGTRARPPGLCFQAPGPRPSAPERGPTVRSLGVRRLGRAPGGGRDTASDSSST